jgi:hypothetical protein
MNEFWLGKNFGLVDLFGTQVNRCYAFFIDQYNEKYRTIKCTQYSNSNTKRDKKLNWYFQSSNRVFYEK